MQENNNRTSIIELSTRANVIEDVVKMIENNPSLTILYIIKELNTRSKRMYEMANSLKKMTSLYLIIPPYL